MHLMLHSTPVSADHGGGSDAKNPMTERFCWRVSWRAVAAAVGVPGAVIRARRE